jgi:hypothetical protein
MSQMAAALPDAPNQAGPEQRPAAIVDLHQSAG